MKYFFIIFHILAFSNLLYSQKLDFYFFSSGGYEYRSTTFVEQLSNQYSNNFEDERIILLLTPSLTDSLFLCQSRVLNKINAEELSLIYVYACLIDIDSSGYYTSIATAKLLSEGSTLFRMLILNSDSEAIYSSFYCLSEEKILYRLKNN